MTISNAYDDVTLLLRYNTSVFLKCNKCLIRVNRVHCHGGYAILFSSPNNVTSRSLLPEPTQCRSDLDSVSKLLPVAPTAHRPTGAAGASEATTCPARPGSARPQASASARHTTRPACKYTHTPLGGAGRDQPPEGLRTALLAGRVAFVLHGGVGGDATSGCPLAERHGLPKLTTCGRRAQGEGGTACPALRRARLRGSLVRGRVGDAARVK